MDEFNNRMDAQRNILNVINSQIDKKEELCGLSKKAIERWIVANQINSESAVCKILYLISEKLFFLANKSQEQISEEYRIVSSEISRLKFDLEKAIR